MIEFPTYKTCTDCPLYESATQPGLPTRPLFAPIPAVPPPKAILIVGEAPGYNEDQQFKSWVGAAGQMLEQFLSGSGFYRYADIYLANACRCRPNQNADPTATQLNACRPKLQRDLDQLLGHYEEVIIFCLGRYGSTSVTKQQTLSACFKHQAKSLDYFNKLKPGGLTGDSKVFFTFHPAMLLPGRSPGKVTAVADHFDLLLRYLKGDFIPYSMEVVPEYGVPVPNDIPSIVSIDIETYGILKGKHQSVFQPVKSLHIDGIPYGEQVVCVSFATKDRTFVYDFRVHKYSIRKWLQKISEAGTTLLGQNIKFDVSFLKMNDYIMSYWLDPRRMILDDTLLTSFLLDEQRPEKGLKELALLFGITDYSRLRVTAKEGRAKSSSDPDLLYYNCVDSATTLALYGFTLKKIKEVYGKDSTKLGPICKDMRNVVLWDTILLELSGVAINREKLLEIHGEYRCRCMQHDEHAWEQGLLIRGEGSEASCRTFMRDALTETDLINDPRVQLTEKRKEISVNKDNFNLLATKITEKHKSWSKFQCLKNFHADSKILTSYTRNILFSQKKGIVHDNIAYPTWYPMPSIAAKYSGTDDTGGTLQGRITCKSPGAQTWPELIKGCLTSRFTGGKILSYDLSQIELRIAASDSGDLVMVMEYRTPGTDRHHNMAARIWPGLVRERGDPEYEPKRYAGKTLNFLVLYKGGAKTFRETLLRDVGLDIPLAQCQAAIDHFDQECKRFREWQLENEATVKELGYLELVTGWSRRWGRGTPAGHVINMIADFPIQTIAAQLLQSGQFEVHKAILRQKLRAVICLQIYDAIYVDCPPEEEKKVDEIVGISLTEPPLWSIIKEVGGYTDLPILFEKKESK